MPKSIDRSDWPWKCPICWQRFVTMSAARRHAKQHHQVRLSASSADYSLYTRRSPSRQNNVETRPHDRHQAAGRSKQFRLTTVKATSPVPRSVNALPPPPSIPALMDLQLNIPMSSILSLNPELESITTPSSFSHDDDDWNFLSAPLLSSSHLPSLAPMPELEDMTALPLIPLPTSTPSFLPTVLTLPPQPPLPVIVYPMPSPPPPSQPVMPTIHQMAFLMIYSTPSSIEQAWDSLMKATLPDPDSSLWHQFQSTYHDTKRVLGLMAMAMRDGVYDNHFQQPLPSAAREWLLRLM